MLLSIDRNMLFFSFWIIQSDSKNSWHWPVQITLKNSWSVRFSDHQSGQNRNYCFMRRQVSLFRILHSCGYIFYNTSGSTSSLSEVFDAMIISGIGQANCLWHTSSSFAWVLSTKVTLSHWIIPLFNFLRLNIFLVLRVNFSLLRSRF